MLHPKRARQAWIGYIPLQVFCAGLSAAWAYGRGGRAEGRGAMPAETFDAQLTCQDRWQPTTGVAHAVNKNTFPLQDEPISSLLCVAVFKRTLVYLSSCTKV